MKGHKLFLIPIGKTRKTNFNIQTSKSYESFNTFKPILMESDNI